MNCELGLHADIFQIRQFFAKAITILEVNVGSVDGDDAVEGCAGQSKQLASEIQLVIIVTPMHAKVSREVVCTESCGYNPASLFVTIKHQRPIMLKDIFHVDHRSGRFNLDYEFEVASRYSMLLLSVTKSAMHCL